MRKKIWKILPLVTGLVLLTASSALTVHGESDNTIDVTLFKLNLPDDWSYDPNDISDYEYTCSVSVFEGADKDNSQNDFTIKANEESSYIAADGNMREFYFWSKDGTLLAEVDCYDMFGTRYPWIEDMKVAEDGSVMVLMTQDRDDDSASELMVFRLTGF